MLPSSLRIHHVLVYRLYVSKVVLSRLYPFQIIRFLYPCIPGISVPSRREKEESTNGTRILTSLYSFSHCSHRSVLIALLTIIEYSIEPFIYWYVRFAPFIQASTIL